MASDKAIIEAIKILKGVFTRWETEKNTHAAWAFVLRDLTDEQLNYALVKFLDTATSEYNRTPQPADLKQLVLAQSSVTWDTAWQEAKENAHKAFDPPFYAGKHHYPAWSSPKVLEVVNTFGREAFQMMRPGDENTLRAQFRNVWENIKGRSGGSVVVQPFIGGIKQGEIVGEIAEQKPKRMMLEGPVQQPLDDAKQAEANKLAQRFIETHANTPQNKIIPMISRKLAGKRSLDAPQAQGWQEDLKGGAVND